MVDKISKEKRSENMSRIRSRDTKPEIKLRSELHRRGFRFRVCRKDLPGKPDIVLPKYKTVIQVHGCFWHRHEGCKEATVPKTRTEWWLEKLNKNVRRDRQVEEELRELGWKVIIVWECELKKKSIDAFIDRLELTIKNE